MTDYQYELAAISNSVAIEPLHWSAAQDAGVMIFVRRDDAIDSLVSGNKFYKLFPAVRQAKISGQSIVSFGGAYSNHIHALAAAAKRFDIPTIGIIRGERPKTISPTLKDAELAGMRLIFVSREAYRDKQSVLETLSLNTKRYLVVPEGGATPEAVSCCRQIALSTMAKLDGAVDTIMCAVGTGGTIAGIISGVSAKQRVIGVAAIKDNKDQLAALKRDINDFVSLVDNDELPNWSLRGEFHCGGYGKVNPQLLAFMLAFEKETGLLLDPVYTGKLFFGLRQLLEQGYFTPGERIVVVHSGGLQGRRGFEALTMPEMAETTRENYANI